MRLRRNSKLLFKSCPRCDGDVQVNRDIYGHYKEYLQCGFMKTSQPVHDVLAEACYPHISPAKPKGTGRVKDVFGLT